jgi:hypothetical protein
MDVSLFSKSAAGTSRARALTCMCLSSRAYLTFVSVRLQSCQRVLGGGMESREKIPRSCRKRCRLDPRMPSLRISVAHALVAAALLAWVSLPFGSWEGKECLGCKRFPADAHTGASNFLTPLVLRCRFPTHVRSRWVRPYLPLVGYAARGAVAICVPSR